MNPNAAARRSMRILLSEGSSLSARQTISALGPLGYAIDVCDPNPLCLGRFSRFVRRTYRCPALGREPEAYLAFILQRLREERYDVLLPVHEQAFLFARVQDRLRSLTGLALTPFDSFALLQSKASFAHLLAELDLPQPPTQFARDRSALERIDVFPCYVKTPYSTAGNGVWRVGDASEPVAVIEALDARGLFDGQTEIIVQGVASGTLSQAQALFDRGRLVAAHCTCQQAVGMGGSQSARLSADHPIVREHLQVLGRRLGWHGALALDYFVDPPSGRPCYIEANPRLVEPMNAALSGLNLPDLLVRLSLGEDLGGDALSVGRFGVLSHSLMAMLLGLAAGGGTRADLARMIASALGHRGLFARGAEDLTPLRLDPPSLIPLAMVALQLLADPAHAQRLSGQTIADYSLSPRSVQRILDLGDS